jgi:hypothetical protein
MSDGSGGSGWGCLPFVLSMCVLWFLLFGATWNGTRYELSCSTEHGLVIAKEKR